LPGAKGHQWSSEIKQVNAFFFQLESFKSIVMVSTIQLGNNLDQGTLKFDQHSSIGTL